MSKPPSGPYDGHESLDEAIDALRRARFRVQRPFRLTNRGFVVEGDLIDGTVRTGMILLPVHQRHRNLYVALTIDAVGYLRHPGGIEHLALVIGPAEMAQDANLAAGEVVDVLERSPVAQP